MAVKLQSGWFGVLALAVVLAVLAALLVLTIPAQDASAKQKQPVESAKGEGVNFFDATFKFNAQATDKDPTTDTAKGKVSLKFPNNGGSYKARIQCLQVSEDGGAYLIAKVTKSSFGPVSKGDLIQVEAFDSGQPNGEGDKEDDNYAESDTCRAPEELDDQFPIQNGDIAVQDAVDLP